MELVPVVAALALLAACGDDGGSSDDAAVGDAGLPDAADVAVDAPGPPNRGAVTLSSYDGLAPSGAMTSGGTASAGFYAPGPTCTETVTGPCVVTTCADTDVVNAQSAGTITVTGGTAAVTLTPDVAAQYQPASPGEFFGAGESLLVTAAGDVVPPFSTTLGSPTASEVTSPDTTEGFTVVRADGLTLAWTGGSGQLSISFSRGGIEPILCTFDAAAGTATVPPAALAGLPTGIASFAITNRTSDEQVIGDWGIAVTADYSARWTGNRIASGAVSIE